nr:peptide chain release factor N(5)-glutamine methyltransferase [Candidatus Gracilibacteria bacterium]
MKKYELVNIGKSQYKLDSKTINQVLEFVLNMDKKGVFLLDNIDTNLAEKIIKIYEKIQSGYPLAYIINNVNFFGIDFYVDENVLIPRDDTEVLVLQVIKNQKFRGENHKNSVFIDIGTGSGIIPISILKTKEIRFENCFALELSPKAFQVAKKNIGIHNLEEKINLINIDFRNFDFGQLDGKDLVITANLPYIKEKDFNNMDFGVYTFEPKVALYGGVETGFELYEELINKLFDLKSNFKSLVLFIEIGFDQYETSKNFLSKKGLKFEYFKDTNNIERVIKIKFKEDKLQ